MASDVDIRVRLRDARRAQRDAQQTSAAIRGIGTAARSAKAGVGDMGAAGVRNLQTASKGAAVAVTGLGVVGVKSGLQFNAAMENAQIRFKLFTKTAEEARSVMDAVSRIDLNSTFNLADLSDAAAMLGNAGVNAARLPPMLQGIANAAAASGGGAEALMGISRAISQIQAKGTLSMEEVRQLQEQMAPGTWDAITKRMGVTKDQLGNLGAEGIDGAKALRGFTEEWTSGRIAGAAKRQTETLGGQWDMLTGNVQKATGAMTLGLAGALSGDVLPAANKAAQAITDIFASDLPVEQQVRKARAVIVRELGPVAHEIGDQIEAAHLDQKLGQVLEKAAPVMADAAVDVGAQAAKAFARAWLESGLWVQLLSVAWLAKRLGAFGLLGGLAATRFRAAWALKMRTPLPGPVVLPPAPVGVPGAGGKKGPGVPPVVPVGVPGKGLLKGAGRLALRAAGPIGGGLLAREVLRETPLKQYSGAKGWGELRDDLLDLRPGRESHDNKPKSRWPSTGIDPRRPAEGRAQRDMRPIVIKTTMNVHGRPVAKAVQRVNGDRKARE